MAARNATFAKWLAERQVLERFRRVRSRIPPLEQLERTKGLWAFRENDQADLGAFYNRAMHAPDRVDLLDGISSTRVEGLSAELNPRTFRPCFLERRGTLSG